MITTRERRAGSSVAAFTLKDELKTHLRRRHDTFTNPLVYTFRGEHGYTPAINLVAGDGRMKRKVEVRMANNDHDIVDVLDRSFNLDVGANTIWCGLGDREFMAVRQLGAWREWTAPSVPI